MHVSFLKAYAPLKRLVDHSFNTGEIAVLYCFSNCAGVGSKSQVLDERSISVISSSVADNKSDRIGEHGFNLSG